MDPDNQSGRNYGNGRSSWLENDDYESLFGETNSFFEERFSTGSEEPFSDLPPMLCVEGRRYESDIASVSRPCFCCGGFGTTRRWYPSSSLSYFFTCEVPYAERIGVGRINGTTWELPVCTGCAKSYALRDQGERLLRLQCRCRPVLKRQGAEGQLEVGDSSRPDKRRRVDGEVVRSSSDSVRTSQEEVGGCNGLGKLKEDEKFFGPLDLTAYEFAEDWVFRTELHPKNSRMDQSEH